MWRELRSEYRNDAAEDGSADAEADGDEALLLALDLSGYFTRACSIQGRPLTRADLELLSSQGDY